MSEKESALKRIALAGIGAVAKGVECVDEFISGKGRECMDELVEKGRAVFRDGMEAGGDLQQKAQQKFDEFCEACRREKTDVDLDSMTPEERAALLEKLMNMQKAAKPDESAQDKPTQDENTDSAEGGE